jgi:hypothetical protein
MFSQIRTEAKRLTPEDFIHCARLLTGSEVKDERHIDKESLAAVLREDASHIDCSQLNELLLMVHKDRVEAPFFGHFFGTDCTIGQIPTNVARFQRTALLLYGNFVFAYRTLSRIKDPAEFRDRIAEASRDPVTELKYFRDRQQKLLDVDRIAQRQTPFVGYLSVGDILADLRRCELLRGAAKELGSSVASWDECLGQIQAMANPEEFGSLSEIVGNFREKNIGATVSDFGSFLEGSLGRLSEMKTEVQQVRGRATKNQNTYLTWDHMDVYFATSMRKAWEYQDLYGFIERLMTFEDLKELDLRYFDPTQAYTDNRVNKGLVEALMLKRARCTVYSVQDTDTLGKDSELASTLAQGKPVIAYIPGLDLDDRAKQLVAEAPATLLERLHFVLYADEQLAQRLTDQELSLVARVQDELMEYCAKRIWLSITDQEAVNRLRRTVGADLDGFCRIVAASEKAVYDKRARTLKESHPLALQVNLETGVANGVLVVRRIADCAALLRSILLSAMEFSLEEQEGMWCLKERISDCIYRVVTNDRKLNNCFWNFYLR